MHKFQGSTYQDYIDMVGSEPEFAGEGRCWKCGIETTTTGIYCKLGGCKLVKRARNMDRSHGFAQESNELANSGYKG
jgi:hypothetical protein